ncbi:hypothetical protein [Streptosporangium sp. OZ121]|uniref:hypothetical protein n=1 Tax=Streptosporangium sp. OZ121 TaxID=3444183 RepID=UPI003F7A8DEC
MTDFPYALDLDILDGQGRKIGMFHVRAPGAADFIAELAEIDEAFATHLGQAVTAVRSFTLLSSELGATPVAQGGAPVYTPRPSAPPANDWQNAPAGGEWPSAPADPWPSDAPPTAPANPNCKHGPMRYVAAGTSQAGKPYPAFWGCTARRDDPSRCKSVSG